MILSNQTGYQWICTTLGRASEHYIQSYASGKRPDEQILVLTCLNDLHFLYKHVINALDSLAGMGYVAVSRGTYFRKGLVMGHANCKI